MQARLKTGVGRVHSTRKLESDLSFPRCVCCQHVAMLLSMHGNRGSITLEEYESAVPAHSEAA